MDRRVKSQRFKPSLSTFNTISLNPPSSVKSPKQTNKADIISALKDTDGLSTEYGAKFVRNVPTILDNLTYKDVKSMNLFLKSYGSKKLKYLGHGAQGIVFDIGNGNVCKVMYSYDTTNPLTDLTTYQAVVDLVNLPMCQKKIQFKDGDGVIIHISKKLDTSAIGKKEHDTITSALVERGWIFIDSPYMSLYDNVIEGKLTQEEFDYIVKVRTNIGIDSDGTLKILDLDAVCTFEQYVKSSLVKYIEDSERDWVFREGKVGLLRFVNDGRFKKYTFERFRRYREFSDEELQKIMEGFWKNLMQE